MQPKSRTRLTNLLGATCLAIADALVVELASSDLPESDATSVIVIGRKVRTIGELAVALDRSQSATVRVVDRLEAAGLAQRGVGEDRRSVTVQLTRRGDALFRRLRAARYEMLTPLVDPLSKGDVARLTAILEAFLAKLTTDLERGHAICRLCDYAACADPVCPVHEAAYPNESRDVRGI